MEKKIFCVACDGRLFQKEDECLKYEGIVEAATKLANFLNKDGCLFMERFEYCWNYSETHINDIEKEMKERGLEKLIDSNPEIKKWVNKKKNFENLSEVSPLCENCEFNCYDKDYGCNICQLFEKGDITEKYDQIKSTIFKEELMRIFNFCKEYKNCEDCPFLKKCTSNYEENFSYCDIVASIFNLYDEILNYTGDDYYYSLICIRD